MISEIRFAYVFDLLRVRIHLSQIMSRFMCVGYRYDVYCDDVIDIVYNDKIPVMETLLDKR